MNDDESQTDTTDESTIGQICSECGGRYLVVTIRGPGGIASRPCCGVTVHVAPTAVERNTTDDGLRADGGASTWQAAETLTTHAELYETPATADARENHAEAHELLADFEGGQN